MNELSKQPVVGVLIDAYGTHQQRVLSGICDVLEPAGFGVLCIVGRELAPLSSTYARAYISSNSLYKRARDFDMCGLISLSTCLSHNCSHQEYITFFEAFKHLPRVSIGLEVPGAAAVLVNNEPGMTALMRHLVAEPSYQRFAFIRGIVNNDEAIAREAIFREVLEEAGRSVDENLIVEGEFLMTDAFAAVDRLLAKTTALDVIVAANDEMAFGAIQALHKHGLSVPGDVAVVGFDDSARSSTHSPPLTTVRQPVKQQGELAAKSMIALLQGSERSITHLETELVIRRSCGVKVAVKPALVKLSAEASLLEPSRFTKSDLQLESLSKAFELALSKENTVFLKMWQSYVDRAGKQLSDLAPCHQSLTYLKTLLDTVKTQHLGHASRLLMQAQTYLTEASLGLQAEQHFVERQKGELQRRTQLHFSSVWEWEALWDSIHDALLGYGVSRCFIVLYDSPDSQPVETAYLQLAIQNARITSSEPERFLSRDLLPEALRAELSQGVLLLEPLSVGQNHFGLMLIDPRGVDYLEFESLAHSISNALRNIVQLQTLQAYTTQLEGANKELAQLANYDVLTGLPNRVLFKDRLEQAFIKARQEETDVALLFLDLDGFKVVNDSLGHSAGDQLLSLVAERLECHLEPADTLARLGGDEFVFILTGLRGSGRCIGVADAILSSFQAPFKLAGRVVHITTSIGITLYPVDGQDGETLLKHADMALYTAKAAGKNCYHFYTPELMVRALEQLQLEQDIRAGLDKNEFELYYQPRFDLETGQLKGFEALLRWHRASETVTPSTFIPVAEETGLILPLGRFALVQACKQAKYWHDSGHSMTVSVNLSVRQLQQETIVDELKEILDDTGLDPGRLELEITESAAMTDVERNISKLTALRNLGIHIAIDDFGTAYSSLNYLKRLPVTSLKIDRSFVRDINEEDGGDSADAAIVKAVVALGKSMGFKLVAEGVETEIQRRFLSALGCDEAQGFLFSEPLAVADLERTLSLSTVLVPTDVKFRFEPYLAEHLNN